jgi:hypothetical protein
LIAQGSAKTRQMGRGGFTDAPFTAAKENEFGPIHKTLRSSASSMICWAETTLPSSRVRSDSLRTNLFKSALEGRSVMGTVSGSIRLAFFGCEGAAASATDGLAGGCGETKVGAGKELLPAGWLAAAAIRAANSLESLFFFILEAYGLDGAIARHHSTAIAQHCNTMQSRMRGITAFCRHTVAIVRHCGSAVACYSGIVALRRYDAAHLRLSDAVAFQCLGVVRLRHSSITMVRLCDASPLCCLMLF